MNKIIHPKLKINLKVIEEFNILLKFYHYFDSPFSHAVENSKYMHKVGQIIAFTAKNNLKYISLYLYFSSLCGC